MIFMLELMIGTLMIGSTVGIHAFALDWLLHAIEKFSPLAHKHTPKQGKVFVVIATVLGVFCSHIAQIWLWATLYLYLGVLPNLEEALYFSTTMFTTLGLGDIILAPSWRLLSSFEAANGFILFGWSTAFIYEVMSKLYDREKIRIK